MKQNTASTADSYVASLPPDRRETIATVRNMVRRHLPSGYEESMGYGMIMWSVPLARLPNTYNGHPLCYVALASQKNYCSLHLMGPYGSPAQAERLRNAFRAAGKKLDMGKACVRFRSVADLPLEPIGELIRGVPVDDYVRMYEASRALTARPTKRSVSKRAKTSSDSTQSAARAAKRSTTSRKPAKSKARGGR